MTPLRKPDSTIENMNKRMTFLFDIAEHIGEYVILGF